MTKYPHWINEEVINQKEIDLSGYHIRSSVVYSSGFIISQHYVLIVQHDM